MDDVWILEYKDEGARDCMVFDSMESAKLYAGLRDTTLHWRDLKSVSYAYVGMDKCPLYSIYRKGIWGDVTR